MWDVGELFTLILVHSLVFKSACAKQSMHWVRFQISAIQYDLRETHIFANNKILIISVHLLEMESAEAELRVVQLTLTLGNEEFPSLRPKKNSCEVYFCFKTMIYFFQMYFSSLLVSLKLCTNLSCKMWFDMNQSNYWLRYHMS